MEGEDEDKYKRYANIPIPTYDEALLSRPSSSNHRGPQEISDDAERQGLLGESPSTPSTYRPPTVESARGSLDSDLGLPEVNGDDARRHIEEMDYMEADDTSRRSPRPYSRTQLRNKFSRRWNDISATLSSIRLPSFRSLYTPVATDTSGETPAPRRFAWIPRLPESFSIPEQYRMSAATMARLFGLFLIVTMIYALFAFDLFPGGRRGMRGGSHFDPESVRKFVQENVDGEALQGWLHHITSYDHVAGTEGDLYLAKWMEERWIEEGYMDEVALMPYYVYLNYPGERQVRIIKPETKKWTASLEEEKVYAERQQTLAFHGHSKSGEVEGPLIYANGGSREDFKYLHDNGVVTNGTIALMKLFGTQFDRSLKIKAAEEAGCIGALLYSDPSDVDVASEWKPTVDSVSRGGVSMMNMVVGDPLTPGWASTLDANRVSKEDNPGLPKIPSLPLSWRDARHLIDSLKDHGLKLKKDWVHGDNSFAKDWFSGNVSSSSDNEVPIVQLKNKNEENPLQQIWNLHGLIEGIETPSKKIVIGNHRDSWCFGSVDPGSGSAAMMAVVRIFGSLRRAGWRPLRTIEFVSWDAEEYNLIGSTEYVEQNIDYLRDNAYGYLNVDVGVSGSNFRAAGSPVWQKALNEVLNRVQDPSSNGTLSLKQKWDETSSRLEGLGAGSDYVAFQDIAGTSSIDFGFERAGHEKSYPYHSCYETFEWMLEHGDPSRGPDNNIRLPNHQALVQVWALLILELADRPILPYDLRAYATAIKEYTSTLERDVANTYAKLKKGGKKGTASINDVTAATNFTLAPLHTALELMTKNTEAFHAFEDQWTQAVLHNSGFETTENVFKRIEFNDRLARFETDLLDPEGIPGRTQFKHVVFGPQMWDGYAESYFPAVRDAVAEGRWGDAMKLVERAAGRIEDASRNLLA